jgi:FtsH-binding integral membrane protein
MEEFHPQAFTSASKVTPVRDNSKLLSLGKIFLWLALGLLVTGVISLTMPDILIAAYGALTQEAMNTYVILLIVSVVVCIISEIALNISAFGKSGVVTGIFYVIYALAMGVLLSTVMITVFAYTAETTGSNSDFIKTLAVAFFVTAGCFGVMGLVGALTKNMNAAIPLVITLGIGILVISLVNFFLQSTLIYWIVDFVVFGLILLVTAIDMHNIMAIANRKEFANSTTLSIYCAYVLYVDFINIFIRVVWYLMLINNRK